MFLKSNLPVLLIEDNPADAQLTKIYLDESAQKLEVYHAESFFDGMEMINSREIELVLLDLSLPDSTGFKTLTRYMEKASHIPVVVLTGTNNEIIGNQAVKAGAQDFLVKGQFDGKLLGRVMRYSLQRFKTTQKLEETANVLAINERRFEEAQRMAQFGNWQMDMVTNEMQWSDEVFRIFNYSPSSFAPTMTDYLKYVQSDDRNLVETFFENAVKDGKMHKIEHRIVTTGHNIKYVALQAKVFYEEMTEKIVLMGGLQDISERKLKEQLVIEKNIALKNSKVKEETIANMSFHIRTPLSSIVNLLYILENSHLSATQKDTFGAIKTSVDDLSLMINNLLNYTVVMSGNIKIEEEEFNIRDLVNSLKKVLQIKADNNRQKLQVVIPESMPETIVGDPRKINQILHNLIENSIIHSEKGGKIIITAKIKEKDFKNYIYLSVEDTGKGITPGKVKELLESEKILEIYTNDKEGENKKLGVAIVSKLTTTMGGSLNIISKEGMGSTFFVEIPIWVIKQTLNVGNETPNSPIKILLVEDHFLNQIATKKVLTSWYDKLTVDIAENGLIGVEKYREHGYDLILMDIQMPVMNGLEATGIIRQKSDVPIIALTANASKQEADKCLDAGCNDYLAKPFKPQELYAKIMSVLAAVNSVSH